MLLFVPFFKSPYLIIYYGKKCGARSLGITSFATDVLSATPKQNCPVVDAFANPLASDENELPAVIIPTAFTFAPPPKPATSATSPNFGAFCKTPIPLSPTPHSTTVFSSAPNLTILNW
jgi:hypothetical protein